MQEEENLGACIWSRIIKKKNVKAKFWGKRGDTQILNYTFFFL
jgi:hypothetical protein